MLNMQTAIQHMKNEEKKRKEEKNKMLDELISKRLELINEHAEKVKINSHYLCRHTQGVIRSYTYKIMKMREEINAKS